VDVAVVYGSSFGDTARVAEEVARALGGLLHRRVPLHDVATVELATLRGVDLLVVGSSTWHAGEVQADWDAVLKAVALGPWTGTRVALFGTGDPHGYPDTFADALGILADGFAAGGAELIGAWPAAADAPRASRALRGDRFVGLALDADDDPAVHAEAVGRWCRQLVADLAAGATGRDPVDLGHGAARAPSASMGR
jgi:flavodoxin I